MAIKVLPSADGHIGAAVAGAGAAEDDTDSGTFDAVDALEVVGIATPEEVGAVDAGRADELPLELDNDGTPLVGFEVLVPGDEL